MFAVFAVFAVFAPTQPKALLDGAADRATHCCSWFDLHSPAPSTLPTLPWEIAP